MSAASVAKAPAPDPEPYTTTSGRPQDGGSVSRTSSMKLAAADFLGEGSAAAASQRPAGATSRSTASTAHSRASAAQPSGGSGSSVANGDAAETATTGCGVASLEDRSPWSSARSRRSAIELSICTVTTSGRALLNMPALPDGNGSPPSPPGSACASMVCVGKKRSRAAMARRCSLACSKVRMNVLHVTADLGNRRLSISATTPSASSQRAACARAPSVQFMAVASTRAPSSSMAASRDSAVRQSAAFPEAQIVLAKTTASRSTPLPRISWNKHSASLHSLARSHDAMAAL
mmetsp:Transcript_106377/g.305819  ORF Transcript_106377/g.305819 Transcript_106377/m.305819 type:complete len:291 (-) Transcript_106377:330-1202(-)